MIYRQKVLIAMVQELGGNIPKDILQPLLFLFCHDYVEHNHYYDFVPSPEGPISLLAQEDKRPLVNKKLLEASDGWIALPSKKRFATELDFFEKIAIQQMKNENLASQPRETLLTRIAEKHPYHASTIAAKEGDAGAAFFTIGYEGLTPEAYLNKLIQNNVRLLCDVRKNAYSQKYGFTKSELQAALKLVDIAYHHMPELGIVSEKRQSLNTDADYHALFDEYEATTLASRQDKLDELEKLIRRHGRIAITCFEADCSHCHRSRVAAALKKREHFDIPIKHL